MAWKLKIEYHRTKAISGRRHGGDAEYSFVSHLKNVQTPRMLAQPGTLWQFL
jgi:hypothetical protein